MHPTNKREVLKILNEATAPLSISWIGVTGVRSYHTLAERPRGTFAMFTMLGQREIKLYLVNLRETNAYYSRKCIELHVKAVYSYIIT